MCDHTIKKLLYSSSEYTCHLFLITSAFARSLSFLSFIVPILAWNVLLVSSVFFKRSLVFPFLLFSFIYFFIHLRWPSYFSLLYSGTLHSFGYIFPFLPCLALRFFPWLFVKPPETTTLLYWISFSLRWFWSLTPVQCYKHGSIGLQALYLI